MKKFLALLLLLLAGCSAAYGEALLAAVNPPDAYKTGVAYHATTADFVNTVFIKNYHVASIRNQVLEQLGVFSETGADIVSTALWFVSDPAATDPPSQLAWRLHFPPSEQELENIEQYAQDVKNTITKAGQPLELHIRFGWLGCADYNVVNPDGTFGFCHYTWEQLLSSTEMTIDNVLAKVANYASYVDLNGDVWNATIPSHQDWFIELYPYFLERAAERNVNGSFHSSIPNTVGTILNPNYTNQQYPEINGHGSLHNIYPALRFLEDNHLPLPEILNISYYPLLYEDPIDYAEVAEKVISDFREIFGKKVRITIGESIYSDNQELRREMGLALARQAFERRNLESFVFWTTPNAGVNGEEYGAPFGFDEYSLGAVYVTKGTTANQAVISWQLPVPYLSQVWVKTATAEALLGCGSGELQVTVNWIQPDRDYLFKLYPANNCTAAGKIDYQADSFLYRD